MITRDRFTRRTLLRGLGAAVALPWLPSLQARAGTPEPKRLYIMAAPNGMPMEHWTPTGLGTTWQSSPILMPMERHRDELTILTNLDNLPVGMGDPHFEAAATLLTGRSRSRDDVSIPDARSMDQVAADVLGQATTLPSLELSSEGPSACEATQTGGTAATCAFLWTVSWADGLTPIPRISHPRLAFERIFGSNDSGESERARQIRVQMERSVLDYVKDDIDRVRAKVGTSDRSRLDAYLTHVRDLETRLDVAPPTEACAALQQDLAGQASLYDPPDLPTQVDLMARLSVLALQCDQTRVISHMLGNMRSERALTHLGHTASHHVLSHHANMPDRIEKLVEAGTWEVEMFAAVLDRMRDVTTSDGGTLLDHTAALFLCSLSDPDAHIPRNVPVLVAGRAGGGLTPMGHVAPDNSEDIVRLSSLYTRVLQALDVPVTGFGASNDGPLADI